MHNNQQIRPDMSVNDLLTTYPQTAEVFVRHTMVCIGCTISSFHTLAEAAAVYDLDLSAFLDELQRTLKTDPVQSQD